VLHDCVHIKSCLNCVHQFLFLVLHFLKHTYKHICVYIHIYTCVYIYIHMYIYVCVCVYSHAMHNDVSANERPHIRRWSHKIIIFYNTIVLQLPTVFSTVTCCTGL
jgi:hypothetical protein